MEDIKIIKQIIVKFLLLGNITGLIYGIFRNALFASVCCSVIVFINFFILIWGSENVIINKSRISTFILGYKFLIFLPFYYLFFIYFDNKFDIFIITILFSLIGMVIGSIFVLRNNFFS